MAAGVEDCFQSELGSDMRSCGDPEQLARRRRPLPCGYGDRHRR